MSKKEEVKALSVYKPTRIQNEIDNAIIDLVDQGEYSSYNAAVNGLLKKTLKIKRGKHLTLKDLKVGDEFKMAHRRSFRLLRVIEHCVVPKNKKYKTRKCLIIDTGQFFYPSCNKKVVKG